jgi:hypothetical protein
MARFALFSPTGLDREPSAEKVVLVSEHFSFWGFLLPLPYCLWHRNWRFSGLLVLLGGVIGLLPTAGLPSGEGVLLGLEVLTGFYVGCAAADIRAAALERNGYTLVDVSIAPDEDQALLRYLDQHRATARPTPQTLTPPASMSSKGPSPVLGLFPEALR